ncbi:hypothetical protein SNE25_21055 [Mucilaginibacter sabulilitoris]|uniref:Phage protein n=1 Tax=Mucilaginibacter sabulilitoris TaxID=1173583 RepID=A0ABZ0TKX4_9SPHI|nr:hypothetical protein [Mucilaginibacter sabulilitoris]WPU91810.1 hypothetical protein SNE25_21055 [Mucilaginibacter sabulilitoris]
MNKEQILTLINEEYNFQSDEKAQADNENRKGSSLMHAYAMGVLEDLKEKIIGEE